MAVGALAAVFARASYSPVPAKRDPTSNPAAASPASTRASVRLYRNPTATLARTETARLQGADGSNCER